MAKYEDEEYFEEESNPYQDESDSGETKCPECNEIIYEDSPRCPYCRNYITSKSTVPLWVKITGIVIIISFVIALFFQW